LLHRWFQWIVENLSRLSVSLREDWVIPRRLVVRRYRCAARATAIAGRSDERPGLFLPGDLPVQRDGRDHHPNLMTASNWRLQPGKPSRRLGSKQGKVSGEFPALCLHQRTT